MSERAASCRLENGDDKREDGDRGGERGSEMGGGRRWPFAEAFAYIVEDIMEVAAAELAAFDVELQVVHVLALLVHKYKY